MTQKRQVTQMGGTVCMFLILNSRGRDQLRDLGRDGRVIWKWILKKCNVTIEGGLELNCGLWTAFGYQKKTLDFLMTNTSLRGLRRTVLCPCRLKFFRYVKNRDNYLRGDWIWLCRYGSGQTIISGSREHTVGIEWVGTEFGDSVVPKLTLFITKFLWVKFVVLCVCIELLSFLWRKRPTRVRAAELLRFLDHNHWHTIVGRTPLDEGSAHRRDLYLITYNTHKEHIHATGWIRTINPSNRAVADARLRPLGQGIVYRTTVTLFWYVVLTQSGGWQG